MAKKRKTHSLEIDELSSILIPDDSELGPKAAQEYNANKSSDDGSCLFNSTLLLVLIKKSVFAVIISAFLHEISEKKVANKFGPRFATVAN